MVDEYTTALYNIALKIKNVETGHENEDTLQDINTAVAYFDREYRKLDTINIHLCDLLPKIIKDIPNMTRRKKRDIMDQYTLVDRFISYKTSLIASCRYHVQKKLILEKDHTDDKSDTP